MKLSSHFAGFLLFGLWVSASHADISLTLRNKQYLPPPIQQLPIKEDYINTQDAGNTQQQLNLEENNYANARYQIFKVHKHYDHSKVNGESNRKSLDRQISFANRNYSPLQKISADKIHIEHINAPADFSLDDHNFDVSYLSLATGNDDSNRHIIVQQQQPGNDGNNRRIIVQQQQPAKSNIPVPFPSDFRHTFSENSIAQNSANQDYQTTQQFRHASESSQSFKDTDYSSQEINLNDIASFKRPDYLPPQHHHGSSQSQQNSGVKSSDDLPPRELLSGPSRQNFLSNAAFKGAHYLPPHQLVSSQSNEKFKQNIAFQDSSEQHNSDEFEQKFITESQFKGPNYLPPLQGSAVRQQNKEFRARSSLNGPDYSSPRKSHETNQNSAFKGPDYLPPQYQFKQSNYESNTPFKGSNVLPPELQSENNVGYQIQADQQQIQALPPGYDFQKPANAEQAIEELHRLPEESSKPEESSNTVYDTRNTKQSESSLSNGISGFGVQNSGNSENAINSLHNQESVTNIEGFKDSKSSLPVYDFQKTDNSELAVNHLQNSGSSQQDVHPAGDTTASSLPTSYSSQKPANAEQARSLLHYEQHSYDTNRAQVSDQNETPENFKSSTLKLTQVKEDSRAEISQGTEQNSEFPSYNQREVKQISELSLQPFKVPEYLSQTFKGPQNLPPNTAPQTFNGPDYTYRSEVFKGPDYLPPAVGSQNYKGTAQLPPATYKPTKVSLHIQQNAEVFKGPEDQSSYQALQQSKFKGPDYLPPTVATNTQGLEPIIMYPLSSYMINIKPYERYANSRPFSEYGLPPTKTTINDISLMYREPSSIPQYYAPAMTYSNNNAFSNQISTTSSALSHQLSRQALQISLPEQQPAPTATHSAPTMATVASKILQTTKPGNSKIRTVKILNNNAVKTIKVLESLDHAGVKTIKILGSTNEPTMGRYRVVNVVSGNNEQNIQTVQIFNDHQDVTDNESGGQTIGQSNNNNYLPPRRKRNPNNKTVIKGSQRI